MRILLDVDGVVADLNSAFLDAVHDITGRRYQPEDVTDWEFTRCLDLLPHEEDLAWGLYAKEYQRDLQPLPGAQDAVARLEALGEVVFVTAPSSKVKDWVWHRERWIGGHFGPIPSVHTHFKHLVAGDVFIDDKWENIRDWSKANPRGLAILWSTPANAGQRLPESMNVCRTNDWNVAIRLVRTHGSPEAL